MNHIYFIMKAVFIISWAIWGAVYIATQNPFWGFLAISNLLIGILLKGE